MRCEIVAVGTELLLGQIVDTNSAWIGEQLALAGIDCHRHTSVGDNRDRMLAAMGEALERSDAVIVTGGLGPTQDDITRDVIAELLGVELVRDESLVARIEAVFGGRGRPMPANNLRQADVPVGARTIDQMPGTAPGLVCPVGTPSSGDADGDGDDSPKVMYAVPGVPWEMHQMVEGTILPDLKRRAGISSVIRSRTLRTWGRSESGLAEDLADEIDRIDRDGGATIAFLASGMEGLKVRLTAKAATDAEVDALLADGEARVRAIAGPIVFGVDDQTMESVVLDLLVAQGLRLATAESPTRRRARNRAPCGWPPVWTAKSRRFGPVGRSTGHASGSSPSSRSSTRSASACWPVGTPDRQIRRVRSPCASSWPYGRRPRQPTCSISFLGLRRPGCVGCHGPSGMSPSGFWVTLIPARWRRCLPQPRGARSLRWT